VASASNIGLQTTDTEVKFCPKMLNSDCECLGRVEILRKVFEAKESNIRKQTRKLRKHLHLYSSLDIIIVSEA
jgi:hypothetical protein